MDALKHKFEHRIHIKQLGFDPPTATAQQKQVRVVSGRPMFYDKPKIKEAKMELYYRLKSYAPLNPIDKPICLVVKWVFLTKDKKRHGKLRTTRPDLDNLQKLLQDVLTDSGFWVDDSYIAELWCSKWYSIDVKECGLIIDIFY